MQVLIQAEDYLPNIGGIATHVHSLAIGLKCLGADVTVLTTRKDVQSPRNFFVARSRVINRDSVNVIEVPIVYSPRGVFTGWQINQRFTNRIRRLIDEKHCDVVHYHFWDFDAKVVAPLKGRVPIVFTNHSSQFLENYDSGTSINILKDRICFADAIIAPSIELYEKTIELGYSAEDCHYVPNCVDTIKFSSDASQKNAIRKRLGISCESVVILCARRAVPKNGLIYFCESLSKLNPHRKIVVFFAGLASRNDDKAPDQYKESLWQSLDSASERNHYLDIRCLGLVPQDNMKTYYMISDISVLPSLKEATSITGLESMASALPLVGTKVGGITEIISDHQEGLLVDPANPAMFADALNELISNDHLRKTLGIAARVKAVKEFSVETFANKMMKIYKSVVNKWK